MNRVTETLGDLYGMHWPTNSTKHLESKLLPYHEELKKLELVYQSGEFERPMWYAKENKAKL